MYFWNINQLKNDLAEKPLAESESFKYAFACVVFINLLFVWVKLPPENNAFDIYNNILSLCIAAVGVCYLYKCNGGANGNHFLQKWFSIGWVAGVRFTALVFIPAAVVYESLITATIHLDNTAWLYDLDKVDALTETQASAKVKETTDAIVKEMQATLLPDVLFYNALLAVYIWRVGKHIKDAAR